MDDVKPPEQQKSIPVMDVQPPRPQPTPSSDFHAVPEPPQQDATPPTELQTPEPQPPVEATVEQSEAPIAEAPQPEVPEEAPAPEVSDVASAPALDGPLPPTAEPTESEPLAAIPGKDTHHKSAALAITIALLIGTALAAFAVLAYTSQNKDKTKDQTANSTQQIDVEIPKASATTTDVDQATKAIDDSLSGSDEAKDLDTNSLSDTSLNL